MILFNGQIAARVPGVPLVSFRTVDTQRLLGKIATETDLSRRSHIHVKALLSGIFAYASERGSVLRQSWNPQTLFSYI
jgi:hypothetical protein